jgi:Ca2+-binding EF-hand superfamily protein
LLEERTGKNLMAIWKLVSKGEPRVQFNLLPERLSTIGAGILSTRELGVLQRSLAPTGSGFVSEAQWFAVFADAPASGRDGAATAGAPTQKATLDASLPGMRVDRPPQPTALPSETWPGGFKAVDIAEDQERAAVAIDDEWQRTGCVVPYSRDTDLPMQSRKATLLSPTFNETTSAGRTPFATRQGLSEIDGRPRIAAGPPDGEQLAAKFATGLNLTPTAQAPFGNSENAVPSRPPPMGAERVTSPFAWPQSSGAEPIVTRMRAALKKRTAEADGSEGGIRGLARNFRICDRNKNGSLELDEFARCIALCNIGLSDAQLAVVFRCFDRNQSGCVDYDEFLRAVRGPLSPFRQNLVLDAFHSLDAAGDGNGILTITDIAAIYDASKHPQVVSGRRDERSVLQEFLDGFEGPKGNRDGTITLDEWIANYEEISANIDMDEHFAQLMDTAWGNLKSRTGKLAVSYVTPASSPYRMR